MSKIYKLRGKQKTITALNDFSLSIKEGEIFGLLGPNGAGKTTLIQILSTLIQPTSGYALIDGINIHDNPNKARNKISLMLEDKMLYNRITGYSNLKFFCKMYNVTDYKNKIQKITAEFNLENWLKQYVGQFSMGMRIKLALCRTLLLNRKLLFLDEPTLGLDVETKAFMVQKLMNLKKDHTIFVTSHDMGLVEKICDRIAFIKEGKIIKIGTKKDIQNLLHTKIQFEINIVNNKNQLKKELEHQEFISNVFDIKNGINISLINRKSLKDLLNILSQYEILSINEKDIALGDLFLKIIGK